MKLTKFEHACFTLEKDGEVLVVDPGKFTTNFTTPKNVTAIIITHQHSDHAEDDLIQSILEINPNAMLVGHADVLKTVLLDIKKYSVKSGDSLVVGKFSLNFYGGDHLQTLPTSPIFPNLGVLIDNKVSYAGDSFADPSGDVEVLLLPVSGSWMKLSMAYEYFLKLKPLIVIPTHDGILSQNGKAQVDKHIPAWTTEFNYIYTRANPDIEV